MNANEIDDSYSPTACRQIELLLEEPNDVIETEYYRGELILIIIL